ncbi:MAG: FkbM family methyltransferase [Alphaproteobacteria bacterium]|nr:FkbM family methyltransferase [Alphaproteobacteria bacterium]
MSGLSRSDVEKILSRYFVKGERSEDIFLASEPELDVDVTIVSQILEQDMHDPDFIIFKHFVDPSTTILDVGANFGYSATSIWKSGSKASVVSFEPIGGFSSILSALGDRVNRTGRWKIFGRKRFEHQTMGVSDREGEITFHTSVINGRIHSALTTASASPDIPSYVCNTFNYVEAYIGEINSFKMHSFTARVTTIDGWIASGISKLKSQKIVAIKIDVEGYEGHVLGGASDLLERDKPLVLAECGHVTQRVIREAFDHGYVFGERIHDQLVVSVEPTKNVNGFFIHPDMVPYYNRIGLMSGVVRRGLGS